MRVTPDVARAGPTSARRRRERRIRSLFRHEQMAIKMAVVTAQHHSAQRCCTIASQTVVEYVDPAPVVPAPVTEYVATAPAVTYAAPAPVVGFDAPAPAVTYAPPAPVIDYVAPAPSVTYAAPAPVFEYVAPAPVVESIAPAPAVSFVAPSLQLRPAYSADSVTTGVNLDAEFVGSASQVVGSLPHGEVFAAPVFHQVHQVPLAGGENPENLVEIPVVPEQVIPLRVVHSLPHAEEFTVYVARRPPPLVDVKPSSRAQRHSMEDLGEVCPIVQILDAGVPVPLMVDQWSAIWNMEEDILDDAGQLDRDFQVPELVIEVPKISLDVVPLRTLIPEPQLAEQLVEVPTVLSPTRIALQIAEIVDTPVHLPESVEWVQLRDVATSRTYFWNRRTRETRWKPPPGIRVVWVGLKGEGSGTGTSVRVPVHMNYLLCLLSKELHRQPRAVYKYWAPCRLPFDMLRAVFLLVAGRPRCSASWPLWIRRTSTRSSSALAVACARMVLLVCVSMPLALCFDWFLGPGCSALRPVWTRRTVARGVQVCLRIQCSAWFDCGYMRCVSL